MTAHDRQDILGDGVIRADEFDLGTGKCGLAEFPQGFPNGAVGRRRSATVVEVRRHMQEPNSFFAVLTQKAACTALPSAANRSTKRRPSSIGTSSSVP